MYTQRLSRIRLLCAAVVLSAMLISATAAHGNWFNPEQRLTTNAADQRWPEVSGTKVVFEDYRHQHDVGDVNDPTTLFDIYLLDLVTKRETCLTPYHTAVARPAMSGNNVVWEDYGHGTTKGGIYHHNLKTRKTRRLPITSGRELEISGNRITYEAFRGGHWRIYVFDLVSNTERRITTDAASPGAPDISGNRVVWQDFRDRNHEIYCFDLATGTEKRLTNNPVGQTLPKISGNRVVWIDERNGLLNDDIYLYDLSTDTEQQITTDAATQWFPAISGTVIAWLDERNGDTDIYMYDVAAGVEKRVTDNPAYQGNVSIAGTRLVYEDALRQGVLASDIYLTQIVKPRVSIAASPTVSYGATARVTGTLRSTSGATIAGRTVALELSTNKISWTTADATSTGVDGAYTLHSTPMGTRRYLRVRFQGDLEYPGAISAIATVKPKIRFTGAPKAKWDQRYGTSYSYSGWFEPRHRTGSAQIRLKLWRGVKQRDGSWHWVYEHTYPATVSNPAGSLLSAYKGVLRLPRGYWRVHAYHAEDSTNAATRSACTYVTVR